MESTLKVRVYDKDTLSDDILGEYDVNLNLQNLVKEDAESEVPRKARIVAPDTYMVAPDTHSSSGHIVAPDCHIAAPDCHIAAPDTYIAAADTWILAPDTCIAARTQIGGPDTL